MKQKALEKIRNRKGFSLVEIIISIILVGMLGLFSIGYITNIVEINQLTSSQKTLVDESKLAMEFLVRELRMSSAATIQCGNPFGVCAIGIPYTQIQFSKLFGYTQDTATAGIQYIYDPVNRQITRTGSATTIIARNVGSFTIDQKSANFFQIDMVLSGSSGENFTLRAAVRPRSSLTVA